VEAVSILMIRLYMLYVLGTKHNISWSTVHALVVFIGKHMKFRKITNRNNDATKETSH
jgi:hypothetical protein